DREDAGPSLPSPTLRQGRRGLARQTASAERNGHRMKTWQVIDAIVISEAREAVEYGLMEAGAMGTETTDEAGGRLSVAAYFDSFKPIETARESVLEALQIYGFE